jgi:hypothetical protein
MNILRLTNQLILSLSTLLKLDDVIKTCENLRVEEQNQLKVLLHNMNIQYRFDGTFGNFNMKTEDITPRI